MLGNIWVKKKKERTETTVRPSESRSKILSKPNMVGQGENHHESERYRLRTIFRGRGKHGYTSELKKKMSSEVLKGQPPEKLKIEWITFDQSAFARLCYSNKQLHLSGLQQHRFISHSGVGCRPATAGVFDMSSQFRTRLKEQVLSQPHGREKSTVGEPYDDT